MAIVASTTHADKVVGTMFRLLKLWRIVAQLADYDLMAESQCKSAFLCLAAQLQQVFHTKPTICTTNGGEVTKRTAPA
jgi:hypothetical protein